MKEQYMTQTAAGGENGKWDLVQVKNLVKFFPIRGGFLQKVKAWVQAVDDVSFTIREGETVGLVGKSGCGKTTVGRTMLRLIEPTSGSVVFNGVDVLKLRGRELKEMRRNMQIIFQDPYASLDPRSPIGESIAEGLKIHNIGTSRERYERTITMLRKVGLEDYHARRYPHEFSGGQRQRIGIARALALQPKFIIADEPVSALDVSIQSQVLNILKDLQRRIWLDLFIHRSQPERGGAYLRPGGSDVPGQGGGAGFTRGPVPQPIAPVHPGAHVRHPHPRSEPEARAHHPARRRAQPGQSAQRLPLPPALPGCLRALLG